MHFNSTHSDEFIALVNEYKLCNQDLELNLYAALPHVPTIKLTIIVDTGKGAWHVDITPHALVNNQCKLSERNIV